MTLYWAGTNSRERLHFSLSIAVVMVIILHNDCAARGRPADSLGITLMSHGEAASIFDTRCYRHDVGQNNPVQIPVHQCQLKY